MPASGSGSLESYQDALTHKYFISKALKPHYVCALPRGTLKGQLPAREGWLEAGDCWTLEAAGGKACNCLDPEFC